MASLSNTEILLQKALRELASLKKEIRGITALINADIRTADRLISVSEACRILGKKKTSVYSMIAEGKIPARRDGKGRYRLSFNQIQKLIQS